MSDKTFKLGLNGEINPCSENAIDLINENIKIIDGTNSFKVERVSSLPGTASEGDAFLVDGDNNIYYWQDGEFKTYVPTGGEHIYDSTNDKTLVFNGTDWIIVESFSGDYDDLTNKPEIIGQNYRLISGTDTPSLTANDVYVFHSNSTLTTINLPGTLPQGRLFYFETSADTSAVTVSWGGSFSGSFALDEDKNVSTVAGNKVFLFLRRPTSYYQVFGAGDGGGASVIETDTFTGDGIETDFTLTSPITNTASLLVNVGNSFVNQDEYSISGSTVTFLTAPIDGVDIEIRNIVGVPTLIQNPSGIVTDKFDGDGIQTTFTLSQTPLGAADLLVFVGTSLQENNWTLSGADITFNVAPPDGTDNVVVKIFDKVEINEPADNSVTTAKINDGAVTPDKLSFPYARFEFIGTAPQSIPNLISTPIEWDSRAFGNMTRDASNPERIQITEDGVYEVSAGLLFRSLTWDNDDYAQLQIYKNGGADPIHQSPRLVFQEASGAYGPIMPSTFIELVDGDYITINCQHSNDSNPNIFDASSALINGGYTNVSIKRIK